MSPLDDELRAMFASRAARVRPAADPLVGIQSRAGRLRRTRVATSVAATALAVSAVAFAVPALTSGPSTARLAGPAGAASPSPEVTPSSVNRSAMSYPWGYDPGPANLLIDWPQRGDRTAGPDEAEVLRRFASAFPSATAEPHYRALFAGRTDGGVRYTMGQLWFSGADVAYDVNFATGGLNGPQFALGKPTDPRAVMLTQVLCCAAGAGKHLLVVVPQPRTGQVRYSPDATTPFAPAGEGPGQNIDGVVLIEREPNATQDRIELLDGNGDLDAPTYRGPLIPGYCGVMTCG